jgi:tetratricopeptide (TPR) repeat protein
MDKQFLQFWVDFLSISMKTQQQMEDIATWLQHGFKGYDELTEIFQKAYGLDRFSESTTGYLTMWDQAIKDFEKSLNEYLSMLGVVPKQEYLDLVEKYEELKKKAASQEETIAHLQQLLNAKIIDQGKIDFGFEELIRKQSDDFQELVKNITGVGSKEEEVKKEPAEKKPAGPSKKKTKKATGKKAPSKK